MKQKLLILFILLWASELSAQMNYTVANPSAAPHAKSREDSLEGLKSDLGEKGVLDPSTINAPATDTVPVCGVACNNSDFSNGTLSGWYGYWGENTSTATAKKITTMRGGPLTGKLGAWCAPKTDNQIKITNKANTDFLLKSLTPSITLSQASPFSTSNFSAMIGDSTITGVAGNPSYGVVATLSQEFTVTPTTNSITYAYAVVLDYTKTHTTYDEPFFTVTIFDAAGDTIKPCGVYDVNSLEYINATQSAGFTLEAYTDGNKKDTVVWKNWTDVNVPLNRYVGQCVTIQFQASDCGPSGHFGYAYVSAQCEQLAITTNDDTLCPNGTATLYGTAAEIHYYWTGPAGGILTNDTLQNVTVGTAGVYTLVVTPITGALCKDTMTYTVYQDNLSMTATSTNVTCFGEKNGTATSTPVNGISPYTYSWSATTQTTQTATGLSAGTYTVTVHDHHGCVATAVVTLTQPTQIIATTTVLANATCGTKGSGTVSATGGVPPYTYLWAAPGGTSTTGTGFGAGTWDVTVTDNNGCTATASIVITQTGGFTTTTSSTPASCNLFNGSATVNPTGGAAPYTYLWLPPLSSSNNTPIASGVSAGTYSVVITDNNDCSQTITITVTQPPAVKAYITDSTNITCNGLSNGTATGSASGGTLPYTYSWSNGQTTALATGLNNITYTLTVTDNTGCTTSTIVTITQPQVLTATIGAPTNPKCNGENTGSATATVAGGTLPYTYSWSTTIAQTTIGATGLSAGEYTITVTDNHGCITTASVTITQPTALSFTTSSTGEYCNMPNGSATVSPSGGTAPYTYSWVGNPSTTATISNLLTGTYSVNITDNNGCTISTTVVVPITAAGSASTIYTNPLCNGDLTGSITVNETGGATPYTYLWSNAQTTQSITGLSAGTYSVTVKDNNGCTSSATVTITQPLLLTATLSNFINVTCNGLTDGSANVTVTGGTTPYTYSWSNGETTSANTEVGAGNYTITVTDNNGCTSSTSVTITQPAPLGATTTFTPASCNLFNGNATVTVSGGTTPYTYLWGPGAATGQTTATATGLNANPYTVIVTDHNGCTLTTNVTVTQPPTVTVTMTDSTAVSCHGGNNGTATATAVSGSLPYTYAWSAGTAAGQTTNEATGLTAGTYTITVTDNVGCISTAIAVITQPALLTLTIGQPTNVLCNGGDNGSAAATATGGTQPYTYLWAPNGQTTATANNLTAGTYTAAVTDNNGCTASAFVIITQPQQLTATIGIPTNVLCNGGDNGSATATETGGTGPYSYSWSPIGGTNAKGTGFTAGTYTVTVTDAHGCTSTADVTITQPTLLSATTTVINVLCHGGTGSITTTPTGGTAPYTYAWTPSGGVAATANNLSAGIYKVTVTDNNGCWTTVSSTITQPAVLSVILTGPQTICSGATGTITANVLGGTQPYTYAWGSPIVSVTNIATVTPTVTTTYFLTVTDANGCQQTGQFVITVGPSLSAATTGTTSFCSGDSATLCVIATGGSGGNTYKWEPGNLTGPCITVNPTVTTTYTAYVTDNCGVTATATASIQVNPFPDVTFHAYLYQGCIPFCVRLYNTSTISSGYIQSYAWKFGDGDTSSKASPQDCYPNPGVYTVSLTATSNFGCSATLTKPDLMTAFPLPVAAFTYSPNPGVIILSPTIQFTDQSTPASATAPIVQWTWPTFGDATDSTSIFENPEHTYQDTGRYCPELIVEDIHGCKDSVTNCLDVEPFFTLYIPSAFSPNGDGLDDTFFPKGVYVKTFEMYIFDRWGEQLYHTNNINQGWDGTVKGGTTISQEDVYIYKIIATDWQNNVHNYIGRVTLLR